MPFPQSVKTEALARAKRCCCICHQFVGLYVNVHHIVPESEEGPNTFENAIVLCLRCHGEVGHFNVAHPIGNKYARQEIVRHRDEWYKFCEGNRLPVFADDRAGESPQRLIDEGRWPALRALLMKEIEQVRQSLGQEEFQWSPQDSKELWDVIEAHESACGGLIALFMILCQNDHPQCVQLATEGLGKIARLPKAAQEPRIQMYPALLALYSGGMASVLAQTYGTLKALLYDVNIRDEDYFAQAAISLTALNVVDRKSQMLLQSRYHKRFVLSYRLCEVLRDSARQYLFVEGSTYEEYFDKFEYFHNLAYSDLCGPFDHRLRHLWPPLGYFVIRRHLTDFLYKIEQDFDRQQEDWPPLRAGFLRGDFSRLIALKADLHERIESFGNSKYHGHYP